MNKKIGLVIVGILAVVSLSYGLIQDPEHVDEPKVETVEADVVMPTKVSRPGCELTDNCYVPSRISIKAGESVSWLNDDSAFHSVTSGVYGSATVLFDSGYMDPGDIFFYTFDQPGEFVYHCTLHEWMEGIVLVS